MNIRKLSFFVIILSLSGLTSLFGLPDYSGGILDPAKVCRTSLDVTSEKYPDANDVVIDQATLLEFNPDGTGDAWQDQFVKILTDKGMKNNQTLSFSYTLPYQTYEFKKVQVFKPDGQIQNINIAELSKVMIDDSQMDANIYNPNDKVLRISIPDLQVGDIIRFVLYLKNLKPMIPDTYFDNSTFEGTSPIKHASYKITVPDSLPVRNVAVLDKAGQTMTEDKPEKTKDRTSYSWEIRDVPRIFEEPSMPPAYSVTQRLLISSIPDWNFMSKWYWNLCKPHLDATTPEMKSTVDRLIKDCKTAQEKINAIYYFVSNKIRYMGLMMEKDSPGFEPHDVRITFNNKYGVCRDKAALLVSMLRLAGFDAYPVIINVGPKLDKEVPIVYFNHAIACVDLGKDNYVLMDPTAENTKDIFPAYLCNRSYIVAKPDGDTLRTTPIIPAEKNLVDISTTGTLGADGKLTAETDISMKGMNDTAYRSFFARINNEEKKMFVEKILHAINPSARLVSYKILPENMLDVTEPLSARITYEISDAMVKNNNYAIAEIPWAGGLVGIVNFVIGSTGLEKRRFPFDTEIACGYRESVDIRVEDKSLRFVSIPESSPIRSDDTSYTQNMSFKDSQLKCSREFLLKAVEFPPARYLGLKAALKQIEIEAKKSPVAIIGETASKSAVENNNSEIDARVLANDTTVNVLDDYSCEIRYHARTQILSYNGKKDMSEIKIPYNPAWSEAKIIGATVTNPDGKTNSISEKEINIMDEDWNASAPRYPGGKILVANLPSVEIGSIIDVEYSVKVRDLPFTSGSVTLRGACPVTFEVFTLSCPENLGLNMEKLYLPPGAVESSSVSNGRMTYRLETKDLPQLKKEKGTPAPWVFLPTLFFSGGDWNRYLPMLNAKLAGKADDQPSVKTRTEELVKGARDEYEKMQAIKNFIAKNIKRAGPAFTEMPLSTLSDADRTLNDGYGNNADTAILYYSMLKQAGFDPEFVLTSDFVNIKQVIDPVLKSPQRTVFNTILVRVKNNSGNYVYFNDTDEYSRIGSTGHDSCFAFTPKDGKQFTIEPLKDMDNKTEALNELALDDHGKAKLTVTTKYYGELYSANNRRYSLLTPEEKNRKYKEMISRISESAIPLTGLQTDFTSYPGIVKFTVSIDNYAVIDKDYYYFTAPVNLDGILPMTSEERVYPYAFGRDTIYTGKTVISLPSGYRKVLISPEDKSYNVPGSGAISLKTVKSDKDGKTVEITEAADIHLKPVILDVEDYFRALAINKKISSPETSTYLLEKNINR